MKTLTEIRQAVSDVGHQAHDLGQVCDVNDPNGIRLAQLFELVDELATAVFDLAQHVREVGGRK